MRLQIVRTLQAREGRIFGFSDKYPDGVIYSGADNKAMKLAVEPTEVNKFKQAVQESQLGQLVDSGGIHWFMSHDPNVDLLQSLITLWEQEQQTTNETASTQTQAGTPSPTVERKSTLQDAEPTNNPVSQTQMQPTQQQQADNGASLQSATTQQHNEDSLPDQASEDERVEHLLQVVDSYMTKLSKSLTIVLDSRCNIIDNGNVIEKSNIDARFMKDLHKKYGKSSSKGMPVKVTVNEHDYLLQLNTIGSQNIAEFHLQVDYDSYDFPASKEVFEAVANKNSGRLLVVTNHPVLQMEPALKMIEDADELATMNCIVVGNALREHDDLPSLKGQEVQWGELRDSHYRYIIFGPDAVIKPEGILGLLQGGKIVILGVNSSSAYGTLTHLESTLGENASTRRSILLSTIGILHPTLQKDTQKNNKVSLSETQFYLLTFTRVQELIEGQLSIEAFNLRLEYPAKVYNLSSAHKSYSQESEWRELLDTIVKMKASDLFIAPGTKIKVRLNGKIIELEDGEFITPDITRQLSFILTTQLERETIQRRGHIDTVYAAPGIGRFRIHIATQRGSLAIIVRPVPFGIPTQKDMSIPEPLITAIKNNPKGLVLTTGATGMGKSTTNAILVDTVMNQDNYVLVSLGDPCEYMYRHGDGVAIQREVPVDAPSFEVALESVFRSNPDIVELGEMRTKETLPTVLRLASSGHLLLCTLHTKSVISSLTAMLSLSDPERHEETLEAMAQSLVAVINQRLVIDKNGNRYPLFEYLILDQASKVLIAKGDFNQLEGHLKSLSESNQTHIARTMVDELNSAYELGIIDQRVYKETMDSIVLDESGETVDRN